MARKFRGAELVKKYREALDEGQSQLVQQTQGRLSAAAPVDTGRLASSFFIGKNSPDRSTTPERDGPGPIDIPKYSGKITFGGEWWISNNLPYAFIVANNPIYGKNGRVGAAAWFTTIQNNLSRDANRIFSKEFKKIK